MTRVLCNEDKRFFIFKKNVRKSFFQWIINFVVKAFHWKQFIRLPHCCENVPCLTDASVTWVIKKSNYTCWCFLIMNIHFPLNSHCGHLNLSSGTPLPLSRRSSPCSSIPSSPNSPEVKKNKFNNYQNPSIFWINII